MADRTFVYKITYTTMLLGGSHYSSDLIVGQQSAHLLGLSEFEVDWWMGAFSLFWEKLEKDPSNKVPMGPQPSGWLAGGSQGSWAPLGRVWFFHYNCEIIAQGEALPKRDIVDTYTHASCARGQNRTKQTGFPTTWGKAESWKAKGVSQSVTSKEYPCFH